jgi:hypothetical protein
MRQGFVNRATCGDLRKSLLLRLVEVTFDVNVAVICVMSFSGYSAGQ